MKAAAGYIVVEVEHAAVTWEHLSTDHLAHFCGHKCGQARHRKKTLGFLIESVLTDDIQRWV